MLRLADEPVDALDQGALFSPCRRWRYLLWRRWDSERPVCAFIGLNPSTADETVDDPTVRRCIGFARAWGYGALHMLNLFAWRATDPVLMMKEGREAVGPLNDEYLKAVHDAAGITVAAWGVHGAFLNRDREVCKMLGDLHCLVLTKDGHPGHPLYLRGKLTPMPYRHGYAG
jgi:hypothetical protein